MRHQPVLAPHRTPTRQEKLSPEEQWLQTIFDAKAARFGRVVRRNAADIERVVGWRRFMHELERRGYHAVENAGQVVIFCNDEPVRVLR